MAERARLLTRPARAEDRDALGALDLAAWDRWTSPAPRPDAPRDPFVDRGPEAYLVADDGGALVGYAILEHPTPLPASAHVVALNGLGVDPRHRGRGIGAALLDAAAEEARRRGARRLTLRVLAPNAAARRLYEGAGFEVEGVLRGEFHLYGDDVDDVLMARSLQRPDAGGSGPGGRTPRGRLARPTEERRGRTVGPCSPSSSS